MLIYINKKLYKRRDRICLAPAGSAAKCKVGASLCGGQTSWADRLGAEGLAEQLLESMMDSFAKYKEFVNVNFLSGP